MSVKRLFALIILIASTLFHGVQAEAREWSIVGPRALGMGGAGVAVADDASATYWNPAAYGFFNTYKPESSMDSHFHKRKASGVLSGGAGVQTHEDLGSVLDAIFTYDFNNFSGGTVPEARVGDFFALVDELKTFSDNPDRSLTVSVDAGAVFQASRYGLGGYLFTEISARGDLDLVNIGNVTPGTTFTLADFTDPANYGCAAPCTGGTYLTASDRTELDTFLTGLGWTAGQKTDFINAVDNGLTTAEASGIAVPGDIVGKVEDVARLADTAAGSGGSISDNTSRLLFKGIAVAEVPVTFGYMLDPGVAIGANVKYMRARVYNTSVDVFNTDFTDALSTAGNDYTESSNYGIDLGVLYKTRGVAIGATARNVNAPEFDMTPLLAGDSDKIKEDRQVRLGVALYPLPYVTVAVDYDLTENDTTVSNGFKSRHLGGGVEIALLRTLKLRAGAYRNMASDDIGLVYTTGLGLKVWALQVDAGASLSAETTEIDGTDIPQEARAELAISALF